MPGEDPKGFALLARIVAIGLALLLIVYYLVFLVFPGPERRDLIEPAYWLLIGMAVGYGFSIFRDFRGVLIAVVCWGLYISHDQLISDNPMSFSLLIRNARWELLPVPFIVLSGLLRLYLVKVGGTNLKQ